MICKKCKTAVPEHSAECQNCGAAINKGAAAKKAMGVIVIIAMVAVCGVYIYFQPELIPLAEELPAPAISATDAPAANDAPGLSETPAPTADLSKGADDVFDFLGAVYDGAESYVNQPAQKSLISRRGFLYDFEEENYVTVQTLSDARFLHESYETEHVFILYIQPSALAGFEEVRFPASNDLTLFTACETKDGIALLSGQSRGVLYREHYNALIERYAYDHGDITRPDSAAAAYRNALDTVISYDMISEDVFVHYMAADEKYAVAVISKASAPGEREGFVLENIDGQYAVVFSHFETQSRFQAAVNRTLPGLNIDLLPAFSLYEARGDIKTEFPALVSRLREEEMIEETDRIAFSAGNDRYAYIVFESGLIILGDIPAGEAVWDYTEVTNWYDAELRLMAWEPASPPGYILWQD